MRIRLPFAGTFVVLLLLAAYIGLTPFDLDIYINDKVLHFLTFLLLTVVFYFILDTNRRRTINLTLLVCTAALGVGSEVLQGVLPNGRSFDLWDIAANVIGSLAGLAMCTWYHKRMLARRRALKGYGEGLGLTEEEEGVDVELGEVGSSRQEEGVMDSAGAEDEAGGGSRPRTLEEEVDNWDENAVDEWDEDEQTRDAIDKGKAKAKRED